MDIDTFIALSHKQKLEELHKHDTTIYFFLEGTHKGTVTFDGSPEAHDKLWAGEVIQHLLHAARHGISRLDPDTDPKSLQFRKTAQFVLEILELADKLVIDLELPDMPKTLQELLGLDPNH